MPITFSISERKFRNTPFASIQLNSDASLSLPMPTQRTSAEYVSVFFFVPTNIDWNAACRVSYPLTARVLYAYSNLGHHFIQKIMKVFVQFMKVFGAIASWGWLTTSRWLCCCCRSSCWWRDDATDSHVVVCPNLTRSWRLSRRFVVPPRTFIAEMYMYFLCNCSDTHKNFHLLYIYAPQNCQRGLWCGPFLTSRSLLASRTNNSKHNNRISFNNENKHEEDIQKAEEVDGANGFQNSMNIFLNHYRVVFGGSITHATVAHYPQTMHNLTIWICLGTCCADVTNANGMRQELSGSCAKKKLLTEVQ